VESQWKGSYVSVLSVNMSRLGQKASVLGAFPPMKRLVDWTGLFNPANPFGGEPPHIDTVEQDLLNTGIGVEWLSSSFLSQMQLNPMTQPAIYGGTQA